MFLFSIFGFLPFIAGIVVLIVVLARPKHNAPPPPDMSAWMLQQRNLEWLSFIEGYDKIAKTPAEKQLVRRMLHDAAMQGLGLSALASQYVGTDKQEAGDELPEAALQPEQQVGYEPAPYTQAQLDAYFPPPHVSKPIDNASLLLYFGAFLFVASVGLFVAFGGASGGLRTLAVFLVMVVMYASGQWLYKTKPKLQQAGLTFAAIGIVIAPLAGLAFYNYVFAKEHGALVWLLTSVFCMLLYVHALVTIRKPLISYLLVFTFLSLFESGVSITTAPIYYYGWGLAFVGIILQLLSRWKGYFPDLKESSRQSSLLFLPIALLTAFAMVPKQGSAQLGISLLLAAAFYGLEALATKDGEQEANAVVSQSAVILAVGCLVYASSHSWLMVVVGVLTANIAQALVMVLANTQGKLWQNYASVLMTASAVDVLLAIGKPDSLLVATASVVAIGLIVWGRQRRAEAYGIASLAFMALPYLYGQINASSHLPAGRQTVLGLMALLLLLGAYLLQLRIARKISGWAIYAQMTYLVGAAAVAASSAFASPLLCLNVAIGIAATFVLLSENDKQREWADAAGVFLVVPILRSTSDQAIFLASLLVALAAFIVMALRYRREFLRWGSTFIWLALPLGFGRGVLGTSWSPADYAWAYIAVMAGLIISRSIARGVLFFSSKIPLASYARSASFSYVFGYIAAACIAVGTSLASDSSKTQTTVILLLLMATTVLLSLRIEKRHDILVLLPILAQAALLSAIRPPRAGPHLEAFLLISTGLAAFGYALAHQPHDGKKQDFLTYLQQASLAMTFVTPVTLVFVEHSFWPMPLGLLVAGALVSHAVRRTNQVNRELAGAIVTVSLLWFLGTSHVHQLQAYVHVVIANLAFYAYWRYTRKETSAVDGYLWAMLTAATVPLAFQALGGTAGGLYGWWLLLEQIVFMLLGMALHKRFVIFWGLYVAVASVIFQLRHLGWAALTVLALFLIGLAVYQLQRHGDQS